MTDPSEPSSSPTPPTIRATVGHRQYVRLNGVWVARCLDRRTGRPTTKYSGGYVNADDVRAIEAGEVAAR